MHHEIAIVGGGPSGSTAATHLADLGFDVCLIEKKIFPREILCGEFLSREVINNLKELNLFSSFLNLKPNPMNSFAMYDDKNEISTNLDFQAYGLKRSLFDNLLLASAKAKGVKVYQPFEVSEISKESNNYKLNLKSSAHSSQMIFSRYVVAAYGKRNYLDAKLERKYISYKSNRDGIKYHVNKKYLKNIKDDQIQIFTADGIYCGVNSVSDEEVTFCFLEDRAGISRTPVQSLERLVNCNSSFKSLFSSEIENVFLSNRVYGSGDIFFGKRNKVENGIFMIGDAAQVIAPLAGDGISMAMDSAKLLANLFNDKKQKNISDADLQKMYDTEWQKNFNRRLRTALFIQKVLFKKSGRRIGLGGLHYFPQALNYFIKNTRG
jgi:flavin-dependent dehydrogenase